MNNNTPNQSEPINVNEMTLEQVDQLAVSLSIELAQLELQKQVTLQTLANTLNVLQQKQKDAKPV